MTRAESVLGRYGKVRSYDELDRWLSDALESGLARRKDNSVVFTGLAGLGRAMQKRFEWLEDSRRRGIDFDRAAREFDATVDSLHADDRERDHDQRVQIMQRASERSRTRRKREHEVQDL